MQDGRGGSGRAQDVLDGVERIGGSVEHVGEHGGGEERATARRRVMCITNPIRVRSEREPNIVY